MALEESFYWGVFLGILAILFLYNLFLYFSTKDKSFIYYSFIIFSQIQIELIRLPLNTNFLPSNFYSDYLYNPFRFFILTSTIFYLLFINETLSIKESSIRIHKIIIGLVVFFSLLALSCFSPLNLHFIVNYTTLITFIFLFVIGIIRWKNGYKPARIIVLASSLFTISMLFILLKQFGLNISFLNIGYFRTDQIGAITFYTLISLSIGDKINTLKKEKIEAQQKSLSELENKVRERTNEVTIQKEIIEEKNKNITDSINYAKLIQNARLPDKNEIKKIMPECFILYKPKDIVSGDFYFFSNENKEIILATADCTGHGVPGAFMSMICSEKLEDAVRLYSEPDEILSHLNKGIKSSLKQTGSKLSSRDGMDIGLCTIDRINHIIKFSGANRPLWLIRKDKSEIIEYKATKKSIGGLTADEQKFDSHQIKFSDEDTIYIFTDGYSDQFNGKTGKKLMTTKFKEILLSIQYKSMAEQEKYLDDYLENWKNGTEQIDDILVIGVRL